MDVGVGGKVFSSAVAAAMLGERFCRAVCLCLYMQCMVGWFWCGPTRNVGVFFGWEECVSDNANNSTNPNYLCQLICSFVRSFVFPPLRWALSLSGCRPSARLLCSGDAAAPPFFRLHEHAFPAYFAGVDGM